MTHKTLQDSGNCPVTGQPLKLEELVPLQTNAGVKVRTTTTASLPGLLSSFQVLPARMHTGPRTRARTKSAPPPRGLMSICSLACLPRPPCHVQDEWNSTVLECYDLRKLLEQTRQAVTQ